MTTLVLVSAVCSWGLVLRLFIVYAHVFLHSIKDIKKEIEETIYK